MAFPTPRSFFISVSDVYGSGQRVPQRYPCGVASGRGRSRQCGGGSCAAGRGTRICRSGTGRSCCRHGRTAYPVMENTVSVSIAFPRQKDKTVPWLRCQRIFLPHRPSSSLASSKSRRHLSCRRLTRGWEVSPLVAIARMGKPYLARVDPLAGESIVVRSHCGGLSSKLSLSGLLPLSSRFQVDFRQFLMCRLCG